MNRWVAGMTTAGVYDVAVGLYWGGMLGAFCLACASVAFGVASLWAGVKVRRG